MTKKWYVVHAYSGFEKNVARSLEERVELAGQKEYFGEILVPTEDVVEMRAGQKRKSERKFFPGYVLVEMELTDDTWHLVKETPRVMGFIGGKADEPAPLSEREASAILDRVEVGSQRAGFRLSNGDLEGARLVPSSRGRFQFMSSASDFSFGVRHPTALVAGGALKDVMQALTRWHVHACVHSHRYVYSESRTRDRHGMLCTHVGLKCWLRGVVRKRDRPHKHTALATHSSW